MFVFCADNNPEILDKFAVLHIDDSGDAVEKVSEVTSSHVKLSEPVFSLKMVLVKCGFPLEIDCYMLIYYVYKPKKDSDLSNLTLHVFLIPHDPALKEVRTYLTVTNAYQYKIQNYSKDYNVKCKVQKYLGQCLKIQQH